MWNEISATYKSESVGASRYKIEMCTSYAIGAKTYRDSGYFSLVVSLTVVLLALLSGLAVAAAVFRFTAADDLC